MYFFVYPFVCMPSHNCHSCITEEFHRLLLEAGARAADDNDSSSGGKGGGVVLLDARNLYESRIGYGDEKEGSPIDIYWWINPPSERARASVSQSVHPFKNTHNHTNPTTPHTSTPPHEQRHTTTHNPINPTNKNSRFAPPGGHVPVLTPPVRQFSELPSWLDGAEAQGLLLKGRTVAMYCTGGVRCEVGRVWVWIVGWIGHYRKHAANGRLTSTPPPHTSR